MGPISVVLKAGLCYNKSRNRGEMTMTYTVQMGERQYHGLRGNLHIHTTSSDGAASHEEVGRIAAKAGLDFIVITDHNRFLPQHEGWIERTLVLVGEEIHDPNRKPQSSHLLCFQIREDVAPHAADPQAVIDAVSAQGGFTFLAHPFERDAPEFLREPNISWRDWDVEGYAGIELWNYMSEFKARIKGRASAILYAFVPDLAGLGPFSETLAKWDELLQSRPVAALGGSDAHAGTYHLGPLSRQVQPYEYLFRGVNTHLLSLEPLTGEVEHDKAALYAALRSGQGFVAYERPGPAAGFTFWAQSGATDATMGQTLRAEGTIEFRAVAPQICRLRLLRDGQTIAQARSDRLTLVTDRPGVYRVEAYRRHAGRWRGWIWSNPIYVS